MNYRHLFHAGSFADVFKHAALVLVLDRLLAKEKPFVVIDSHAGAGLYDLWAPEAGRGGEWRTGIQRLMAASDPPAEVRAYLSLVQQINPDGALRWYPGSPLLAALRLRRQDRLAAIERHPDEAAGLRTALSGKSAGRIEIREGDGYAALKALLPPTPRRGVVVIDPPYESPDEGEHLVRALKAAWRRWPTGHYLVWYPTKDPELVAALHRAAAELTEAKLDEGEPLVAELHLPSLGGEGRLSGCGLLLLNPPWQIEEVLSRLLPALAALLGSGVAPLKGATAIRRLTAAPSLPSSRPSRA